MVVAVVVFMAVDGGKVTLQRIKVVKKHFLSLSSLLTSFRLGI